MQRHLGKFSIALVAALLAVNLGSAAAGTAGGYSQQQDPPKDCRKDPNDPRCKK